MFSLDYDGLQHCPVSPSGGVVQELQQKRAQRAAEVQHVAEVEVENLRQTAVVGRKKPPRISPTNKSPASPSNNNPLSPTVVKAKNTGLYVFVVVPFNFWYCTIICL